MPKFLVIYRQGNGCDYTIGCGLAVHTLEAPSLSAAIASVINGLAKIEDDAEFSDETVESLKAVDVYEIAEAHVSLERDMWIGARRAVHKKTAQERAEAKERAELERLKKKYEK